MLADLMADYGGFEHNMHSLRVVEELEHRYPEFPGLNLTYEVRESIVKHSAHGDTSRVPQRFRPKEAPLLEASLVDEVDSITYDCHDIDDGIRAGIIQPRGPQEVELWRGALQQATDSSAKGTSQKLLIDRAMRVLFDSFIGNLVETSSRRIESNGIKNIDDVRAHQGEGPDRPQPIDDPGQTGTRSLVIHPLLPQLAGKPHLPHRPAAATRPLPFLRRTPRFPAR